MKTMFRPRQTIKRRGRKFVVSAIGMMNLWPIPKLSKCRAAGFSEAIAAQYASGVMERFTGWTL